MYVLDCFGRWSRVQPGRPSSTQPRLTPVIPSPHSGFIRSQIVFGITLAIRCQTRNCEAWRVRISLPFVSRPGTTKPATEGWGSVEIAGGSSQNQRRLTLHGRVLTPADSKVCVKPCDRQIQTLERWLAIASDIKDFSNMALKTV